MTASLVSFGAALTISVVTVIVVFALIRRNLRDLLKEVLDLPPGTDFYLRILFIGLLFVALSSALGESYNFEKDTPFMEYVWRTSSVLSSVFMYISLFMALYLVLVTILVAVLKRRNEQ